MTMLAAAERFAGPPVPCPGPIPTSEAHAETCAACGKCGAVTRFLERQLAETRLPVVHSHRQAMA